MKLLSVVASLVAAALAGAALAVSLYHAGPRGLTGPQGPAGPPGRAADAQRLRYGICWIAPLFTQNWADGSSSTWISDVSISSPQLMDGVYQCPAGEQFVSIVPIPG